MPIFVKKINIMNGFKTHPIYPMYQVNANGVVCKSHPDMIVTQHKTDKGYMHVLIMRNDGKYKWQMVHRLVAQLFIPNPLNKTDVNHKDGNKTNNNFDNLEWMTHSENIQHSFDVLGRKMPSGELHYNYGRVVQSSTRKLMSEAKTGSNHPKFKGYYVLPDGSKHESSYLAYAYCRDNSLRYSDIYRRCKAGKYGYSFEEKC